MVCNFRIIRILQTIFQPNYYNHQDVFLILLSDPAGVAPKRVHLYMENAFLLSRFCRVISTEAGWYCLCKKNLIGTKCAAERRQMVSANIFGFLMSDARAWFLVL